MIESRDRLISKPLIGLLMGLAAFLLAVLPEMLLARFMDTPFLLLVAMLLMGLILLKFLFGPQLTMIKLLLSLLAAIFLMIPLLWISYSMGVTFLEDHPRAFSALLILVTYGTFGAMFGLINFNARALRVFLPVFLIFPLAVSGWDALFPLPSGEPRFPFITYGDMETWVPEALDEAILTVTKLSIFSLGFYLSLGLLFGLSIAFVNGMDRASKTPGVEAASTVPPEQNAEYK